MAANFTILGSGSSGNCSYLETEGTRVLVDAGFSARQIRQRMAGIGRAPENLTGILITHEHSDHVQGLVKIAGKLNLPVYCNRATQQEISRQYSGFVLDFRIFTTGDSFDIGDVVVETYAVPHDAQDPVGFVIHTSSGRFGFATDLGHVTKLVLDRISKCNVLVLESNHDVKLLQECLRRPWSLKQRILSRHGHLSNEAAGNAAAEIMNAELQHLYLGHLSRDCNTPELARIAVQKRLDDIGASHTTLHLTKQDVPCPTLTL